MIGSVQATVIEIAAPGEIRFREEELPANPQAGMLLCRTIVTAISPGTEIAAFTGLPHLRPGVSYPRLVGYCNVAEVTAVGEGVERIREGDRVLSFTSHRSHALLDASDVLYVLAEDDDPRKIVCAYLFHLGYNAVLRGDVRAGSRVAIIGLGVLGLTSVASARLAGAETLAISGHTEARDIALEFGADIAVERSHADIAGALGERLADVVIATTNSWDDWRLALQIAAPRGTICCLGFPGRGSSEIPSNPLDSQFFYAKQLRIEAVGLSPESSDSRGFIRFDERSNIAFLARRIRSGHLDPARLVSGEFDASSIEAAYQALANRSPGTFTFILAWDQ